MPPATESDLVQTLHERFGLEQFRPGQREVIEEVLKGRDVLCVMPTGGGKSLCYQLPALIKPGLTLVVSPLIALMKDQVDGLNARGIRATLINSTIDLDEQRLRIQQIEAGAFDLVYVAPERFRSTRFVEAINRTRVSLLAIDEAHCISEWGHDFRPDYARIGQARRSIGRPPCIALTATATDVVRRDIADQLDLDDPAQFVTGFDRPNLSYAVIDANRDREKLAVLAEILASTPGSAIVYASSRSKCESVAQFLTKELRKTAVVYHAGMTRDERERAQNAFMASDAEVVVATNAFGMGIDKPDIRSVIHFNYPGTVEAYYQEAGRAGRDGLPARCVLLYSAGDRMLQEMFIENEYPPKPAVYRVYDYLRSREDDPIELTHAQIKEESGVDINDSGVGTALKILEGAGVVERFQPRENQAIIRIDAESESLSMIDRVSPQAHTQRLVLRAIEGLVNRRHGEPVYFHPDSIAAQLGIDRSALLRAIKILVEELPISYVPPFRGNATRVLDRGQRAKDLVIDFTTLEMRKRREYGKLERMINYAQTRECRRANILGYFGDEAASRCGKCDNCGIDGALFVKNQAQLIETEQGQQVVLKALSGVARAKGRVGKNLIAQMLVGSTSEKVQRAGLKQLSTFGLLGTFRQVDVVALLDALGRARLIAPREIEQNRPVLDLTDEGRAYMKAPSPLSLDLSEELAERVRREGHAPTASARSNTPPEVTEGAANAADSELASDPLWQTLRDLRRVWAKESGHSAFTVFSNATLDEIVRVRPRSPAELAQIKGLGAARLERYGRAILDAVIKASPSAPEAPIEPPLFENPDRPVPAPAPAPAPVAVRAPKATEVAVKPSPAAPRTTRVSAEEWTFRLVEKGFSLEDVAAIRNLDRAVVVRHLAWIVRQGKVVDWDSVAPLTLLERLRSKHAGDSHESQPSEADEWPGLWPLLLAWETSK